MSTFTKSPIRMTTKLRELLKEGTIETVGIYDCLSARLAEDAGFSALHLTGMGTEATLCGAPDLGVMTMTELVSHAARITSAVNIPVVADMDTGFGSLINVHRAIREMERAGVAGVHIEDQADPKSCPTLGGRKVLDREAAIDRVKVALDARTDPDFVIVARSDADCISIDEVIERCNLFLDAGADMAMPCYMQVNCENFFTLSPDEQMTVLRRLGKEINGPLLGMGTSAPKGYSYKDMAEAGFAFLMHAGIPVRAVANALAELFAEIKTNGNASAYMAAHPGPYYGGPALANLLGIERYTEIESLCASTK